MRVLLIALALVVTGLAAPGSAQVTGSDVGAPQRPGWDYRGQNELAVYYTQQDRSPRRLWVRGEYRVPHDGVWGVITLYEYDCQGRSRVLQQSQYSGVNLSGEPVVIPGDGIWQYVVPGTAGVQLANLACSRPAAQPRAVGP